MTTHSTKVLIMAGGTGGHIFPGLAVAEELVERGWQAFWLGSKGGMEEELVGKTDIKLSLISIAGLRGKGITGWLKAPLSLTKAVYEAINVFREVKPSMVVGFGGFASGPGGLAAFLTGTPLIIHEQNAIAGMTNKVLSKLAKRVFQAFPGAFSESSKLETVGNPVRLSILSLREKLSDNAKKINKHGLLNILVVGGSRGALALNKNLPKVLSTFIKEKRIAVRHQVGKGRQKESKQFYLAEGIELGESVVLSEFITDMAEAMAWADLVICRAGASTVSEIATAGLCAVFVPFPFAVDDHQTANANWLVRQEAAICIQEKELLSDKTKEKISLLLNSPSDIQRIASKAQQAAYLNAATKVADYCEQLRNRAA